MKNWTLSKEDGEILLEIYRSLNVDGTQKRHLTADEMVLIYAIGDGLIKGKLRIKDE